MCTLVILATGGTIAGTADDPLDNVGYTAAQRGVAELVAAVPALAGEALEGEQVTQLDSKDMDIATWLALAEAARRHLARPEVAGVVVTHGTDTLEETAWFLHRWLAPGKPLVLTAAMRPATALAPDGPQNLLDATRVARHPGATGVLAVVAGQVHAGQRLRKRHTYRPDAFGSGDAGPLGVVEEGGLRLFQPFPGAAGAAGTAGTAGAGATAGSGPGLAPAAGDDGRGWPWVELLSSHAAARPDALRALLAAGVDGLVLAGTGNGTVHRALEPALADAAAAGVPVWRTSRCPDGVLVGPATGPAGDLTPWQARVELMLQLRLRQAPPPQAAITPPSA